MMKLAFVYAFVYKIQITRVSILTPFKFAAIAHPALGTNSSMTIISKVNIFLTVSLVLSLTRPFRLSYACIIV